MVSVDEAHELSPLAGLDGVLAGAFCPLAGHATPEGAVQGYASAARANGARIETHANVTGVEAGAVRMEDGRTVEAGCMVCAAGPWSREVGALAGIELDVTPERRRIAFTGALDGLPHTVPMTIDFSTGFYFHREGPGLLFGMADPEQPAGADAPTDPDWLARVLGVAERRCPSLLDLGIAGGWKGAYEITPDHNALVGESSEVTRFLYATGFSGHGFLQGPAVGEIVRDLVLGNEPFVDVAPLSADRFEHATPRPEHNVI
jgi:sarcosine oxidase subunit beta